VHSSPEHPGVPIPTDDPVRLPVSVAFVKGSRLLRQGDRSSDLPMVDNGPPGTFVLLPGLRISLPTDQIVTASDDDGRVTVEFYGMRFVGLVDGQLEFHRVREQHPPERLSPARSFTMRLDPAWVDAVHAHGARLWPA